ncbi:MAG TPA: AAA family ATPase [Solirubrobacteraceae bacterium]|nr:AAA family ATPase [Solirubrobacteraceae bacterium]
MDRGDEGLLERDAELGAVRDAVGRAASGTGGLLVIEGPAGIGKSALLAAARAEAATRGLGVLSARGLELEHEFAFGVARQLFETLLARAQAEHRQRLLDGAAGLVAPLLALEPGAERDGAGARPVQDRGFTLIHGLYWLTVNLADNGPLLLAVDDAHHADTLSLRFLAYLAARCSELPVLVAATIRTGEPGAGEELLAAVRRDPAAQILTPGALSDEAVTTLVRRRLAAGAAAEFCVACAHACAGNPFLLGELLAQLESDRVAPVITNIGRVEAASPDTVTRSALARLDRLGPDATALAYALAILENSTLSQATELARLSDARAAAAADALFAAQILSGAPLRFVHPLLRRSIYEQIPPARRAADHGRAALMLMDTGASRAVISAHLLRAPPSADPRVVRLLREAAREALQQGDSTVATALLHRALEEATAAEQRSAELLAELGQAEALASEPAAVEHLGEALALTSDPAQRTALACALGELLVWRSGRAVDAYEMLTRTLTELGPQAPAPLRAAIETLRLATASVDVRLVSKVAPLLGEIHELADAAGSAGRGLKIFEACWAAQTGQLDGDWRARLREGLDGGRFVADHTGGSPIVVYATIVLVLADDLAAAEELLADVRADARARGSIISHLVDLAWGALLYMRRGELERAIEDGQAALVLAERTDAGWARIWLVACLADALRERGELEQAAALIDSVRLDGAMGTSAALHALIARGRVRLAQGDREQAVADLRLASENVLVNNPSFAPWRPELAAALAASDPQEARLLAEASVARARELGQARGIGIALRALARVAGGEEALPLLEEAVTVLRDSPARLELAHALCDHGAALRRAGQRAAARGPLQEGLALAQACGAVPLAQAARDELLATGSRLRREALTGPEALTPSERRVAELASTGMSNREIAQSLFVTTKTVGTHLAHIYQKLDLSGQQAREQLGERLQRR